MVKAKDLLKKSPDEFEEDPLEKEENPKKRNEEDRVNEAYENISKRLEEIRNGKVSKDDEPSSSENEGGLEDEAEKEEESEEVEKLKSEDPLDQEEDLSEDEIEEENEEEVEKMVESGEDDKIVAEPVGKVLEEEEETESLDSAQDREDEPKKTFVKRDGEDEDSLEDEDMDDSSKRPQEKEEVEDSLDDLAEEELEDAPQPSRSFASEARFDDEEFKKGRAVPRGGEDEDMHIPQVGSRNGGSSSIYSKYGRSGGAAEDTGVYEEDYSPRRTEPERDIFASKYQGSGGYNNRRSGSKLHLLILVLIGLAVIGGTVYLLKNQFETKPQPTPSTQITESTPAPTPSPEPIARAEYKVRILNGTETSGLAKTVSEKLQGLGYQIERTGNATNSAFESTVVRAKSGKIEIIDQLIADLAGDYSAASSPASLRDNDGADAEVILGGN
jgi:hypothetical protein